MIAGLLMSPKETNPIQRLRAVSAFAVLAALGSIVLFCDAIRAAMGDVCADCPGWPSTAPKRYLVLAYALAVWWPLLLLLPCWLWAKLNSDHAASDGDGGK